MAVSTLFRFSLPSTLKSIPQKTYNKKLLVSDHKRAILKRKDDGIKKKNTINKPKTTTLIINPSQNNNERKNKTGFDSIQLSALRRLG